MRKMKEEPKILIPETVGFYVLGKLLSKEKLADLIVAFCDKPKAIRTFTFPSRKELLATAKQQTVLRLTIEQEQQRSDFEKENPKAKHIPRGAVLQNVEIARQAGIDPRDRVAILKSAVKHMQEFDDTKRGKIIDEGTEIKIKFDKMQALRERRQLSDKIKVDQEKKIQTFKKPTRSESD